MLEVLVYWLGLWHRLRAFVVAFNNEIEEHRVELAQLYPHEACIMSCRTLAIFGLPTFSFAIHNFYLIMAYDVQHNRILACVSLVRVVLAIPRPYLWWQMYTLFKQARQQPTSRAVAVEYLRATKHPISALNETMSWVYMAWLTGMVIWLLCTEVTHSDLGRNLTQWLVHLADLLLSPLSFIAAMMPSWVSAFVDHLASRSTFVQEIRSFGSLNSKWLAYAFNATNMTAAGLSGPHTAALASATPFELAMIRHCWVSLGYMLLQRIVSVIMFNHLVNSDIARGLPPELLEEHCTTRMVDEALLEDTTLYLGERDCPICHCEYEIGDELRVLPCRHPFHKECVDQWLLNHRSHCPLCERFVGPEPPLTPTNFGDGRRHEPQVQQQVGHAHQD